MTIPVIEGKTKIVFATAPSDLWEGLAYRLQFKNAITAGDGARTEDVVGKASATATTAANVFRLLELCGLPVAYLERVDEDSFYVRRLQMLLWELVVRRNAFGSALAREPSLTKGERFNELRYETYLKTTSRVWKSDGKIYELPCDDPLARFNQNRLELYHPKQVPTPGTYFTSMALAHGFTVAGEEEILVKAQTLALSAFQILEYAFSLFSVELDDFKIEVGITSGGMLYIGDDIGCDSWRARCYPDGYELSKQPFREGEDGIETLKRYQRAADITTQFLEPETCARIRTWWRHHDTQ